MNHTIKTAETDVYLTLLQLAENTQLPMKMACPVAQLAATIKDKSRYAHAPFINRSLSACPWLTTHK